MRPVIAATVAGALVAGGFFAGHTRATRDVSSSLHAQAKQLDDLRSSVEELSRSLSLLAMIRPTAAQPPAPSPEPTPAPAPALPAQPPEAAPVPAPPSERHADDEAMMTRAEAMFADASSRGRWTPKDEEALRQIRNDAPGADWSPFMQKLASAINAGRLRPTPADSTDQL